MAFWQGKKVLITGHTGFKGSWLSLWLQLLQAEVVGIALPPATTPNLFTLADIEQGMSSTLLNVCDADALRQCVLTQQPEIVFHMAAQPLVRYSYDHAIETYATNVMGTVHLFEAVKAAGSVKAVVNITTDKCYENKEWCWGYREQDRLGGFDPYSNSKACAELVSSAYRDAYFRKMGIGLATARAGNVIGGGDWAADRLVPDMMRACMSGQVLHIRNAHAVRPWQHVLEPLNGYLQLAEKLWVTPDDYAGAWNFGPDEDDMQPVGWMADFMMRAWGEGMQWVADGGQHVHEAHILKLDCAKAKTQLGWQSQTDLKTGLRKTLDWYKALQAGKNMRAFTVAQIEDFMALTTARKRELNHVE